MPWDQDHRDSLTNIIAELESKVGTDSPGANAALVAVLSSQVLQLFSYCSSLENQIDGVVDGLSAGLAQSHQNLLNLVADTKQSEDSQKGVVAAIQGSLNAVIANSDAAHEITQSILSVFSEFGENIDGLTTQAKALAEGALGSFLPGSSAVVKSLVDKALA